MLRRCQISAGKVGAGVAWGSRPEMWHRRDVTGSALPVHNVRKILQETGRRVNVISSNRPSIDGDGTSRGLLFSGLFSKKGRGHIHFADYHDAIGGSNRTEDIIHRGIAVCFEAKY